MSENPKFISLDIVFYGSSLNYDWGGGTNYQELKKITKWDGRQYVLVSRYALRYSILHWANKLFPDKWKLAGKGELETTTKKGEKGVAHPKRELIIEKRILNFPEFDLFGFMIAEQEGEGALTRVSPVKITHAISLTPTNFDTHVMANLDMVRRAGGVGSNPVTIEEKADFYVYNVTIDVERVGKYMVSEHGDESIGDINIDGKEAKERICQLVETILNLKRDIKGRREDLSPWLAILGIYYDGKYETYMDKIVLDRKTHYKVRRTYKKEVDTEIVENEIEEGLMPLFRICLPNNQSISNLWIYYREGFCDYLPKIDEERTIKNKDCLLELLKSALGIDTQEEKP
ncbi:MAG: type I-B CRISPR-associated protein Cas7/Cst2/DevR [Archaeoglobaceae archaeon]